MHNKEMNGAPERIRTSDPQIRSFEGLGPKTQKLRGINVLVPGGWKSDQSGGDRDVVTPQPSSQRPLTFPATVWSRMSDGRTIGREMVGARNEAGRPTQ